MPQSSSDERIDLHAIRHGLKLKRDTGSTKLFENREELGCPVCDEPYHSLFASEERHNRFDPDVARPFCVVRDSDRILVFTHA